MTQIRKDLPYWPDVAIETMLHGIASQVELIPGVIDHVAPQVEAVVSHLDTKSITNIFTTGCGDSYYAPVATRLAFEKYSGYRTEPMEALEFSRYTVDYVPKGSLVISISAGGGTSRSVEAVRAAKRVGAATVAITGSQDSPISREADGVITQNEHEFRAAAPPGEGAFALGNYLASMLVLYLLALELGRANGSLSETICDDLMTDMHRASQIIRATIAANDSVIQEYAQSVTEASLYLILGGGPSYATAMFAAAKLFEFPQAHGMAIELEEWAHPEYFLTRPDTVVFVVAPPGNSLDRAREQMAGARDMGATVVAICDQNDRVTMELADVSFPIMGELPEEFSPLTYCVPGELFAVHLCSALNKPAFAYISPKQCEVNMRQTHQSHMR